ncbi:hypothetical protein JVU11DRAFT_1539 [Chiua virens]|nr:hypothetical protein JVU11DRAFT_1539 [Chiua virens]
MPLVVPILRAFLIFLNVYETFKNFKPPPPSARRGGKPSERAMNQRKRDLKGCLAVWVVWCCYAVHERTFDRVVGIFLPFYSEIKSVFLLFLLLTRAKGAEPLFLHVLRPLIKPYAVVVDPTLELSRDLGDFFFALLQVPMDYILSLPWYSFWRTKELEKPGESTCDTCISAADSGSSARASNHSSIPVLTGHRSAMQTSRVLNGRYGSLRSISDNQYLNGRPSVINSASSETYHDRHPRSASATSLPAYSEHPSLDPPRYSQTLSRDGHQIWYPPASVHSTSSQEAFPSEIATALECCSPEWRIYPAFPSAYPPTPLPAAASLPRSVTLLSGGNPFVSDPAYPTILEDEQDFCKPLGTQHEEHPGSVQGPSNDKVGVTIYGEVGDASQQLDGDTLHDDSMWSSEAGLSEDDFGASLRTPLRSPGAISFSARSSVDSLTSPLITAGHVLPLSAKSSSDSLSSGSSSLAGRKRTHGASQGKDWSTLRPPQSHNATLRGRPVPLPIVQDSAQSSASDEGERQNGDGDDSTKAKRQRTLDPLKRKSTLRPVVRGVGNARKSSLPSRSVARGHSVTTVSQATIRIKTGSVSTNSSTIKARKANLVSRQVMRGGPQGVSKTSSTSSSQSGTLKGRPY